MPATPYGVEPQGPGDRRQAALPMQGRPPALRATAVHSSSGPFSCMLQANYHPTATTQPVCGPSLHMAQAHPRIRRAGAGHLLPRDPTWLPVAPPPRKRASVRLARPAEPGRVPDRVAWIQPRNQHVQSANDDCRPLCHVLGACLQDRRVLRVVLGTRTKGQGVPREREMGRQRVRL